METRRLNGIDYNDNGSKGEGFENYETTLN